MSLVYITGPSGSGKSTVAEGLRKRGFEAHDADTEICSWYTKQTSKKVEYPRNAEDRAHDWQSKHSFLMSEALLDNLLRKSSGTTIFVCGIAPNDLQLAPKYFSKVLCLMIDEQTMTKRVTTRTNNTYGQAPDQLETIQKWYQPTVKKYLNFGAVTLDASQPIELVLDEIISLSGE